MGGVQTGGGRKSLCLQCGGKRLLSGTGRIDPQGHGRLVAKAGEGALGALASESFDKRLYQRAGRTVDHGKQGIRFTRGEVGVAGDPISGGGQVPLAGRSCTVG